MILTNELPRMGDSSGALAGRMIVLPLTRSWFDHEDKTLTDRLLAELPSILLWTIAGWQRLRERGYFVQPDAGRELLEEMEDLSSPVGAFVKECCVVGVGRQIARADLYAAWRGWCEERGREPGEAATFGRNLRAAVPSIGASYPRDGGGRVRMYEGIALAEGYLVQDGS